MDAAKIELRSVKKYFGEQVRAVDDVSLTIEPGSLVTLLGPSGSGKTTILRAIAGFEDITDGEILIDGESIAHVPTHRRRLGMVAQDYALFPHMTVRENLVFGITSARRARRESQRLASDVVARQADEMLGLVGLDGFQERRPQQLSGGQKQRVALARALVTKPRVLLLDEPFAALDKHLREQLQVEVRRVQEQVGITTVFVTHDQSEALSMSDKIAVLSSGKVEQYASPVEIYESPATRFVAGFIGRINLLSGELVEKGDQRLRVKMVDGTGIDLVGQWPGQVGSEVQFSVRPERLGLVDHAQSGRVFDNVLPATVKQVVYLGDRVDVVLSSEYGELTSNFVGENLSASGLLSVGDSVSFGFAAAAATPLPDSR